MVRSGAAHNQAISVMALILLNGHPEEVRKAATLLAFHGLCKVELFRKGSFIKGHL